MSRLIDADALKLGIISQSNTGRESYSTELICEFIDEQPTVGEWIPCSERLPEESGTYEVTAYDAKRLIITYVKWQPKMKSWNLTGARSYWKIIAWRERPEPYRPEGGNQ